MSYDINRWVGVGRLTKDPELKYTPSGMAACTLSIAVGERPKQDGTDVVSFFEVQVWGKLAENVNQYQKKGSQIVIDGRLVQDRWTDQQGNPRSKVKIVAERVEFTGGKKSDGQANTSGNKPGDGGGYEDSFYDNTGFDPGPVDPNDPGF